MVTMKDLLECGVHFGHQTRKWNPKMKKFIFCSRKNIHIIDLQKTLRYFRYVYSIVKDAAAEGKTIMFVGTKKQAGETIRQYAQAVSAPYVDYRWLGGMLTNFSTIKKSVRKLELIEEMENSGQIDLLTKKEKLMLTRKKEKLEKYLGGVRHMKKLPDMIFIIDVVKEHIAVEEARNLGIAVIAPLDTNCNPDKVDYPIPGNDDAIRSIQLFCKEISEAIIEGREMNKDLNVESNNQEKDGDSQENIGEIAEFESIVEESKTIQETTQGVE
ncbi:30S ribosomal protein S2 [Helicobacter sp. 16-1353]|uniref:30S ribosomal protein S2 n=1 Tax=Helicobacter sp. 16-1353 TaxID=2004996 RepID=UPI000DCE752D|nr:30S ribosomal protein S2 [Helicobacter sp. 16-1353]RAX55232.1 30S ribosomal protein S2 [Helicobacter sp. 16-1353]